MGCCASVTQEEQDARAAEAGAKPLINDIQTQQGAPGLAVTPSGSVLVSTMHREGSTPNGRVFEYAGGVLTEIIAGIESAQGVPGLAVMSGGEYIVNRTPECKLNCLPFELLCGEPGMRRRQRN
eukprot:SAG11_NODE_2568_length_3214_cov_2.670947_2_plen_124_part_00